MGPEASSTGRSLLLIPQSDFVEIPVQETRSNSVGSRSVAMCSLSTTGRRSLLLIPQPGLVETFPFSSKSLRCLFPSWLEDPRSVHWVICRRMTSWSLFEAESTAVHSLPGPLPQRRRSNLRLRPSFQSKVPSQLPSLRDLFSPLAAPNLSSDGSMDGETDIGRAVLYIYSKTGLRRFSLCFRNYFLSPPQFTRN